MKQQVIDRFSKTGRLKTRLEEIERQVEDRELARMDGGDLIGRHIVANLLSLPSRSSDESRLLFEAQRSRAQLYQASSGATALEAAEALSEARTAAAELGSGRAEFASLVEPAWAILQDLLRIGSRRNAWICFNVLFDAIEATNEHAELRPEVIRLFTEIADDLVAGSRDPEILDVLLKMCDWTRTYVPDDFPALVRLIPNLLAENLEAVTPESAIRAYLYARHLCLGMDGQTLERLVGRLMSTEQIGAEARSVYNEFLASFAERAETAEADFERLAYVNPAVDLDYDSDLDSLSVMLSDHYPERPWVWRNRALMFRRRRDTMGALACLGRAMNITGEPPELMGLLSPVLAQFGFLGTAHQFSRFLPTELRTRFHLEALDLLAAQPGTESGKRKLAVHLEGLEGIHDLPPEFRPHIATRRAELLFEVGENRSAGAIFAGLMREDPSNELAAIRLAEISYRFNDLKRARSYLKGGFTDRVLPLVEHLLSRVAEAKGDLEDARVHNLRALTILPRAQSAGRESKEKAVMALQDRIRRMLGEEHVDCALIAMLQMETFSPTHHDLDILEPVLERRAIALAMKVGDVGSAREVIRDIISRRPADTDVFVAGIRASLGAGQLDEALEFIGKAESAGRSESAEIPLLRGLVYARRGEPDLAEEWISKSISHVPTAEARLALATLRIDDGREEEATEILCGLREEEGGTPQLRSRVFELAGRLLERSGHHDEALARYERAVELSDVWGESHRRAGVMMIEQALATDAADGHERLTRGLTLLEGFNDPEAVTRAALARAALSPSPAEAASVIGGALKRTAGRNLVRLQVARARYLAGAGAEEALHRTLEEILDEDPSPKLRRAVAAAMAAVKRRLAGHSLREAGGDGTNLAQALRLIREAAATSRSASFEVVEVALRKAAGEDVEVPTLKKNAPAALAVLTGVVHGLEGQPQAVTRRVQNAAENEDDRDLALAARLALALTGDDPVEALAALDELERAELSLPYPRLELLGRAAAKAVARHDMASLDRVLEMAPGHLDDIRLYRRLLAVVETSAAEEDTSAVLGLLTELERSTSIGGMEDPALGDRLRSIRNRITSLKETPSPAWASARMRTAGKRTRVHVPSVLAFWKKLVSDPDRGGEAMHNVALMLLSSAHEAETAEVPAEDLWRAAHEAWACLCRNDEFWLSLGESVEQGSGHRVGEALRRSVPMWLLEAQLGQARRCLKNDDIASGVGHGRVVATSPLVRLADEERVRDELFSALSWGLERHLHNGRVEEAMQCIDRAVVADSGNQTARREMVRVAASALDKTLSVMESLTTAPDDTMVFEACSLMTNVLATAESCVRDLLAEGTPNADTIRDLSTCTRALAFVLLHRHHDPAEAASVVDRAIQIAEEAGVESAKLCRVRSDIGLEMVERTMSSTKTTAQVAISCPENPIEQALAEIERLLALDPENTKVVTQKARILLACDRDDEAEELARDLFHAAQKKADPSTVRSAVELLHQVQSERERVRYEGRMEVVDRMVAQHNWRAALDVFTDAIVGRENEAIHLVRHVEILLGLRKLDRAEAVLRQLADCAGEEARHASFEAELACVRRMSEIGGDVYSAFDLMERCAFDRALQIVDDVLGADDRSAAAQLIAAISQAGSGHPERARGHAAAALRCASGEERTWMSIVLESRGIAA